MTATVLLAKKLCPLLSPEPIENIKVLTRLANVAEAMPCDEAKLNWVLKRLDALDAPKASLALYAMHLWL